MTRQGVWDVRRRERNRRHRPRTHKRQVRRLDLDEPDDLRSSVEQAQRPGQRFLDETKAK